MNEVLNKDDNEQETSKVASDALVSSYCIIINE